LNKQKELLHKDAAALFYIVQYNGESAQISTKVKGLGQAFFPKGAGTDKST